MSLFLVTSQLEDGVIFALSDSGEKSTFATGLASPSAVAIDSLGVTWVACMGKALKYTDPNDPRFGNDILDPETGRATIVDAGLHVVSTNGVVYEPVLTTGEPIFRPSGLALGPDGILYVSSFGYGDINEGWVSAISPHGVIKTIATGLTGPGGILVDGDSLLVTCASGYETGVWRIPLNVDKVGPLVVAPGEVEELFPSPDALWGICHSGSDVLIGNATKGRILRGTSGASWINNPSLLKGVAGLVRSGDWVYATIQRTGKVIRFRADSPSVNNVVTTGIAAATGIIEVPGA